MGANCRYHMCKAFFTTRNGVLVLFCFVNGKVFTREMNLFISNIFYQGLNQVFQSSFGRKHLTAGFFFNLAPERSDSDASQHAKHAFKKKIYMYIYAHKTKKTRFDPIPLTRTQTLLHTQYCYYLIFCCRWSREYTYTTFR